MWREPSPRRGGELSACRERSQGLGISMGVAMDTDIGVTDVKLDDGTTSSGQIKPLTNSHLEFG